MAFLSRYGWVLKNEIVIEDLIQEALAQGFSRAGALNMNALVFMPEVREMCAADRCRHYDKNWCCPPACGSIEEASERASQYSCGVLVQTIGKMEDDFDFETIMSTSKKHDENFAELIDDLKSRYPDILPMGAGACGICEACTYPDAPCRYPEKSITSMEAYGLWVNKVCELSDVPYNNGQQTITYISCYLL